MSVQQNEIYQNDCLTVLSDMDEESIDLIYLDPPFFTQKKQSLSDRAGYEYAFDDSWPNVDAYILYLEERVIQMKRVLKRTGSLFLHCDSTAVHYLRAMLDRVFGVQQFRSEIIWTYRRWSNCKNGLIGGHQTILWYSKTKTYVFNQQYHNYSPSTNVDQIMQERVRDSRNKTVYKVDEYGNQILAKSKRGVPLSDVWDIPFLNPKAKERTGYPTQKPVLLLERIINIASNEGDIVLDPFCGSGTTLVAAQKANRFWIGIDINDDAVSLSRKRLEHPIVSQSGVLSKGRDSYRTQPDYVSKIIMVLNAVPVQRNKGIDGFINDDESEKLIPVRVQRAEEPLSLALELLLSAAKKRRCEQGVLVSTSDCEALIPLKVPANILLIQSPLLQYRLWNTARQNRQ